MRTLVMPSEVGVPKPWYFPIQPRYWFPDLDKAPTSELESTLNPSGEEDAPNQIPIEVLGHVYC